MAAPGTVIAAARVVVTAPVGRFTACGAGVPGPAGRVGRLVRRSPPPARPASAGRAEPGAGC